MKAKAVSELSGAKLDYWVGRAQGLSYLSIEPLQRSDQMICVIDGKKSKKRYDPSTNWAIGGPIIESERIRTHTYSNGWHAISPKENKTQQKIIAEIEPPNRAHGCGETILIAGMRCYLESVYGEVVGHHD